MSTLSVPATPSHPAAGSKKALWTGRVLSAIPVLFLLLDAVMKLVRAPQSIQATTQLGFSADVLVPLGAIELACVVLYLVRRTSPLGAILLTGYLGGAVASHLRPGDPLFSHVLFPVYVGALLWAGLWLRDPRVRAL